MRSERIKFTNSSGIELSARMELPISGKPRAYALFAHCFTCSKNLNVVGNISLALTQNNIAVMRFDFTGLGQSEGDFKDSNFSSNIQDLIDASNYMEKHYDAPKIIIGHSLGGAAVLRSAGQIESIQAVVTIGAPAEPGHIKHLLNTSIDTIEKEGEASVSIGGRPFTIKQQFIDDLERNDGLALVKQLGKALLILHSPQDTTVSIENAGKIYDAALHPKSFVSLDGADHLLTNDDDSLYAGQIIASWSSRYVDLTELEILETDKHIVTRTGAQGYTTEIKAGHHYMVADEPTEVGGKDLGPTPYGYLTAGLGACTSMTLRMYADHKKWDLQEVTVHLSHEKNYLQDSDNTDGKNSKIDIIEIEIELEGNLDQTQRTRLLEIAHRCPVHKTLHNSVKIEVKLRD